MEYLKTTPPKLFVTRNSYNISKSSQLISNICWQYIYYYNLQEKCSNDQIVQLKKNSKHFPSIIWENIYIIDEVENATYH